MQRLTRIHDANVTHCHSRLLFDTESLKKTEVWVSVAHKVIRIGYCYRNRKQDICLILLILTAINPPGASVTDISCLHAEIKTEAKSEMN